MIDLPLRWSDRFAGPSLGSRWSGGHANPSTEATIHLDGGLHIVFVEGSQYASAAVVTRAPLVGDFDARVRFSVTAPAAGTTFELAAIGIDPPREPALDQAQANAFTRSRVYDVHGAPPYVSSEYDEDDGWRIGWNRGSSAAERGDDGQARSDNHYNRYGRSSAPAAARPLPGWLRLVRIGTDWAAYRLRDDGLWVATGEVQRMNLPDAVFLRLAAKHWVKRREGSAVAPANHVTFFDFELRSADAQPAVAVAAPAQGTAAPPQPIAFGRPPEEVALVQELRGCRSCAAFSSENLYGPFPQVEAVAPGAATRVRVRGFAPPEPAALYGCRKAPIMLIGINPNLPGHFVLPRASDDERWRSGSLRLAPFFADDAAYARHYRFGPSPAAGVVDAAGVESLLCRELLRADKAGTLAGGDGAGTGSFRHRGRRGARMQIEFDDGTHRVDELSWSADENLAVVRRRFAAGEVVAGRFDAGVIGRELAVQAEDGLDGYYRNAGKLLARVGGWFAQSKFSLGEDMSLHDAVACASPRWDAAEMPVESIGTVCVHDRRWLHRQIEHSAPEVIVFAGRTALRLFETAGSGTFSVPLDQLPAQAGGRDGLYATVAANGLYWTYRAGPSLRKVALVLAPHMSYGENFRPHAYLEAAAWGEFAAAHPHAAAWLTQRKLLETVFESEDRMALLGRDDDPAWAELAQLDALATHKLKAQWLDPFELLGSAVATHLRRIGSRVDAQGHLQRSAGPCRYCDNEQWRFDGGCRYEVAAG